jgi:pimeloyl-ACP methyl ester carboxylesterase
MDSMKNFLYLLSITALLAVLISCEDNGDITPEDLAEQAGVDTLVTSDGVQFVRTPDIHFHNLPNWSYEYQYVEIDGLRQAYAEAGPSDGDVVLLLHGQPSWSYLYRKMIPVLADSGYHVIAMDHLGMGRSDKPIDINYYSYLGHAERLEQFIQKLGLTDINLFVQDWGSLIGLRVAGLNPDWFATISVGNGDLIIIPEGDQPYPPVENPNEHEDVGFPFAAFPDQQVPFYDGCELIFGGGGKQDGFGDWIYYAMKDTNFHASEVVEAITWFPLSEDVEAAYDAPFPSREYMAGVRVFPSLINQMPGLNEDAWAGLTLFEKPFLTIWGGNDVGMLGSCETQQKLIAEIPGAEGQPHDRLSEAGHFLQNDQGEEIARRLVEFYKKNSEQKVGFEIIQIVSPNEIITWKNVSELTVEEFEAIDLPQGWLKNQPREGDTDAGFFARSPGELMDGPLIKAEHFGYEWEHVATITEVNVSMDDQGLLSANTISKYHEITYYAWRLVNILVSPEGDRYIRVTRDEGRTSDTPTIPSDWELIKEVTTEELNIQLPNPTINIRADNEDSFQGPIDQ